MALTTPWRVARLVYCDETIVLDGVEVDVIIEARILPGDPGWENDLFIGGPEIDGYKVLEAHTRIELDIPEEDNLTRDNIEDQIWCQVEKEEIL